MSGNSDAAGSNGMDDGGNSIGGNTNSADGAANAATASNANSPDAGGGWGGVLGAIGGGALGFAMGGPMGAISGARGGYSIGNSIGNMDLSGAPYDGATTASNDGSGASAGGAGAAGGNGMYATAAGNAAPLGDGSSGAAGPAGSLTSLAQADSNAGQNAYNLQAAQYQWGQNQFNSIYPYAQQYMQSQLNATNQAQGFAQGQQNFYNQNYQPLQKQFVDEAANYNSPARAAQAAGAAETDVANSFGAQRSQALANLESYGIDPSQTRYGALDASSRIAQAAATAAAGTQSRLQTEATGLGLQGQAINVGQGYAGNIATTLNSGTNAGNAGISALNATTAMGANTMGTPTQWNGLGTAANTAGANAINQQNSFTTAQGQLALGNNQLGFQKDANNSAGVGQLVGGALGLAGSVAANSGGISNLLNSLGT